MFYLPRHKCFTADLLALNIKNITLFYLRCHRMLHITLSPWSFLVQVQPRVEEIETSWLCLGDFERGPRSVHSQQANKHRERVLKAQACTCTRESKASETSELWVRWLKWLELFAQEIVRWDTESTSTFPKNDLKWYFCIPSSGQKFTCWLTDHLHHRPV